MKMLRRTGILPYLISILYFVPNLLFAQQGEEIRWRGGDAALQVMQHGPGKRVIRLQIPAIRFHYQHEEEGDFVRLLLRGMAPGDTPGLPDLPVIRRLLTVAAGEKITVEKITWHTKQISLKEKFPGKKLFPRQISPPKNGIPQQFVYDRKRYRRDEWLGDSLITLHTAGIMRGEQVVLMTFSPFRYNPVRDLLKVYDEVEVTLAISSNTAAKSVAAYATPLFPGAAEEALSALDGQAVAGLVEGPVRYLILTDTLFRNNDALEEFIRWKTQKGFRVEVICKSDPGVGATADSIKNYLTDLYLSATPDNPAPVFLLIVGDTPQIPVSATVGHVTDLYYATYDGPDDYLPDLYYGRIPARDTTELRIMLDKILEYEQYRFPDPAFLKHAVLVAGVDGSYASRWGNGQINYATRYYVNPQEGYDPSVFLYPASGDQDAEIRDQISNGVSLVNYTGHGLSSGWLDPSFRTADVEDLQNAHKYPLFITNGCQTATFEDDECFAEALVRADNKGAVGYIGCTNDSYWDEDYYWAVGVGPIVVHPSYEETSRAAYDRLYHNHGEPPQEWYVTADQIIFAGNLEVMAGNPSRAKYYWEIYHLLGDPSMMSYLAVPDTLEMHIPRTLPAGASTLTVVTEAYTYVGLTCSDSLLDASLAGSDGTVHLTFSGVPDTASLLVTATRQQRIPVWDTVHLIADSLPYLSVVNTVLDDTSGNSNGIPDNGEQLFLDLQVENSGNSSVVEVTGTLSCTSPWVEMIDSLTGPFLLPGETDTLLTHAFQFRARDSIPDEELITFRISFADTSGNRWEHWFTLTLHAPVPVIVKMQIDDHSTGNGNLRLDAGETVDFVLTVTNSGHALMDTGQVYFSFTEGLTGTPLDSSLLPAILPGDTTQITVASTIAEDAPYGAYVRIISALSARGYMLRDTFYFPVGLVYEDFETGDLLLFPWENNSEIPWQVTGQTAWNGTFSAVSGDIGDSQISALKIECEVLQDDSLSFYFRVSSEGGYDYLRFFIDSVEQEHWSGEIAWGRTTYPVNAGTHNFMWQYTKDGSVSKGLDRAWIDFVVFPKDAVCDNSSAVRRFSLSGKVLLYPNPAGGEVILRPSFAGQGWTLLVMDVTGRKYLMRSAMRWETGEEITIPLRSLRPGIYFIFLSDGQQRITLPFIKR